MENQRKCSNEKHSELNAVNYCKICNLYLCNKCSNNHLEYFDSHPIYNLVENNHQEYLKYLQDYVMKKSIKLI